MSRTSPLFWMLAGLLSAMGCRSMADKREPEKISTIEVGKTTKTDAVNILGLPNKTFKETLPDGRVVEHWIYFRWADRTAVIVHGRFGSGTVSSTSRRGTERRDHAATLIFSDSGIVVEVQTPVEEDR